MRAVFGKVNVAEFMFHQRSIVALEFVPGGLVIGVMSVQVSPDSSTYVATATPQGNQAQDLCGTFTIANNGVKTVTGTASNCWN